MKDCWKILGMTPTNDIDAIKRRRRELIKQFHPDAAKTPEKKRSFTIKCAHINNAFDDATKLACSVSNHQSTSKSGPVSASKPNPIVKVSWYSRIVESSFVAVGLVALLVVFVVVQYLTANFTDYTNSLSDENVLRIVVTAIVTVIGAILIFGMLMGFFDMVIAAFFPSWLLAKLGLERLEAKIIWLTILIFHIYVFYFTNLGIEGSPIHDPAKNSMAWIYSALFRFSGAFTIPTILAFDWIRDFVRYKHLRKSGFNIQLVDKAIEN